MATPGNGIGQSIPLGWYTRTSAAKKIGRDRTTIIRWEDAGLVTPDGYRNAGKLVIPLYSEKKIRELRRIARSQRPGRKKKE